MTLVFINNPPDAWWEMSMPHSRVLCIAAQYFSLFCSRISLTGLAADERGVHNPSWKNCIVQHTCSRIAWLLSTIRFGLFLNKRLLSFETPFYSVLCKMQTIAPDFLKWKSVCRKFNLLTWLIETHQQDKSGSIIKRGFCFYQENSPVLRFVLYEGGISQSTSSCNFIAIKTTDLPESCRNSLKRINNYAEQSLKI